MSNCIQIHSHTVEFRSDEIDLKRLRAYVRDDQDFLTTENVTFADRPKSAIVRFGQGRSTHTWRDFRFVLNYVIRPLMKRSKVHTFQIADEFDGFDSIEAFTVDFKKGDGAFDIKPRKGVK